MSRLKDICIDCVDPWALAHWWAETLDHRVRAWSDDDLAALREAGLAGPQEDPSIAVDPLDGAGPSFFFNLVPEAKVVKNRVHVDVWGDVDELVARGATVLERHARWTVIADPEGNELCVMPLEDRP